MTPEEKQKQTDSIAGAQFIYAISMAYAIFFLMGILGI
jgi:hypothetical protein